MPLFESSKQRQEREAEEQRQQELNREAQAREAEERRKKKLDDFLEKVKEYSKDKNIFAITISDDVECKQILLEYMVQECGYICTQNDAFGTKYTTHYAFTFVKPEYASKFGIAN